MTATDLVLPAMLEQPYVRWLGVEAIRGDAPELRVSLPYREDNSNLGGTLHGGVLASLVIIAARAAAVQAMAGARDADVQLVGLTVQYLGAVSRQDAEARAQVLRTGRNLCFVGIEVLDGSGQRVTQAQATLRIAADAATASCDPPPDEVIVPAEASEPSGIARMITRMGFISRLGLSIDRMADGEAALHLPWRSELSDGRGQHHDGALAALFDTTGAMSAFAMGNASGMKAVTPALHLAVLGDSRGQALHGYARTLWQRDELYVCEVRICASDGRVCARGDLIYRIT
jgi:uncharacterized protein (TIGR00369 family)